MDPERPRDAPVPAGDARGGAAESWEAAAHPERPRAAPVSTGDARVDAAIERLAAIDEVELVRRPMVLEDVHARLRAILGELGAAGGPGVPGEQAELG